MKNLLANRKLVITFFIVIIVLLTLVAFVPLVISLVSGRGVQTEGVNASHAKAAEVELDGDWTVTKGKPDNHTSVGFTFHEVLPAEKKDTSGSTTAVSGDATIENNVLEQGTITVDMDELTTDKKVRDQNMKSKLFETTTYPEATFTVTKPVDLSAVPDDGTIGKVSLTGDLTIKDQTHEVTEYFDVLRDGKELVVGGDIPINRTDYDVNTPELIAAKIDEDGFINIRISFKHAN